MFSFITCLFLLNWHLHHPTHNYGRRRRSTRGRGVRDALTHRHTNSGSSELRRADLKQGVVQNNSRFRRTHKALDGGRRRRLLMPAYAKKQRRLETPREPERGGSLIPLNHPPSHHSLPIRRRDRNGAGWHRKKHRHKHRTRLLDKASAAPSTQPSTPSRILRFSFGISICLSSTNTRSLGHRRNI